MAVVVHSQEGKDKNFLKKVAQHVRNGANVKGTRHRATQPPVETLRPQPNGGIAGGRDNNNDPRDSYESPTRVPPETYDNDYFRASQEAPVDVMNPGYRENSPTTRPNLPYSTGQQYTAGL
ncbi:hypothetical protein LSAT2_013380 [Lamellibrachia satsuma]|nr:hypothetical protein LSAT2_013380 [Lamellibrachia satsuma]